jgi:hypothetical protein
MKKIDVTFRIAFIRAIVLVRKLQEMSLCDGKQLVERNYNSTDGKADGTITIRMFQENLFWLLVEYGQNKSAHEQLQIVEISDANNILDLSSGS